MRTRLIGLLVALVLVAAACGNAGDDDEGAQDSDESQTVDVPGVTDTEIKVGGIAAKTGPLGSQYEPIQFGIRAYLDMVNEKGGVHGRKINFLGLYDDATNPSRNVAQARKLVEEEKVFAIVGVASPIFGAGEYLGQQEVPTFGWNVNPEWIGPPNLFGEKGSFLNFTNPGPGIAWLAKQQLGVQKVGIIAYTVVQSADCAKGFAKSYRNFGLDVVLEDASLQFGATDISADIEKVRQSGTQFLSTCMDPSGNTLVARSLNRAGLDDVKMWWPNGYDQETLEKFGDLMEGVYFSTFFVPFERPDAAPGMKLFLEQMKKRFPDQQLSEVVLAGWINADLFVTGLEKAGRNLTREKLIDAINEMTRYTAGGILAGIDWTKQHTEANPVYECQAFIRVENGKFVPVFGTDETPFTCFDPAPNTKSLETRPFEPSAENT
jgi:branched-chain amino acid transport system substrate-binding protein